MYDEDGLSSVSFWKVTFSLLMRMEKNMDTKHISEMEAILDEANEILDTLDKNLNRLNDIQAKIQKLENYYTSKQWIDEMVFPLCWNEIKTTWRGLFRDSLCFL